MFNDQFRGPTPGSMALIPQNVPALPGALGTSLKQLVIEKLPSGQGSDLAVRDSNTGFTFFNIQGQITITTRLRSRLPSRMAGCWFQKSLPVRSAVHPMPVQSLERFPSAPQCNRSRSHQLANGHAQSVLMPPMQHQLVQELPNLVPGPDVIVGDIEDVDQQGNNATQVGLAIGTDSCNNGDQPVDWFALPQTDHPLVPQNLYRMSGGVVPTTSASNKLDSPG